MNILHPFWRYCQAQPQLQPNLAEVSSILDFSTPPTQPPVKVVNMAKSKPNPEPQRPQTQPQPQPQAQPQSQPQPQPQPQTRPQPQLN